VKTHFDNWKDAVEEFDRHANTEYHKTCVLKADNLMAVSSKKQDSVDMQVITGLKSQIAENRRRLTPIIETIIFCGRQGLALRGHRDSGPLTLEEPLNNDGNFRALLRFKVHSGDQELANHLKMAAENATYLSPSTQNEIVAACNGLILAKLVERVNSAKGFTVLADETTDISGTEQFSLCARYVDPDGNIREDFLQFVPVTDVSGEGLASVIVNSLTEFGLNLAYLRGQGYDGAGAMSGKLNGVQARIRSMYPLAVYVHCASHSLNLAISDACTVVAIRNCVGTLGDICNFFYTFGKATGNYALVN
jgi:hypothetical protein